MGGGITCSVSTTTWARNGQGHGKMMAQQSHFHNHHQHHHQTASPSLPSAAGLGYLYGHSNAGFSSSSNGGLEFGYACGFSYATWVVWFYSTLGLLADSGSNSDRRSGPPFPRSCCFDPILPSIHTVSRWILVVLCNTMGLDI
jgi:hypothetical protein